jgi:tRNA uridine 5-carbamoylmethylation protein Kti12
MSEDKRVQIIIAGYPASGKTTVANIICAALKDAGLEDITLSDEFAPGELEGPVSQEKIDVCAKSMVERKASIHVQTRQIRAVPFTKPQEK